MSQRNQAKIRCGLAASCGSVLVSLAVALARAEADPPRTDRDDDVVVVDVSELRRQDEQARSGLHEPVPLSRIAPVIGRAAVVEALRIYGLPTSVGESPLARYESRLDVISSEWKRRQSSDEFFEYRELRSNVFASRSRLATRHPAFARHVPAPRDHPGWSRFESLHQRVGASTREVQRRLSALNSVLLAEIANEAKLLEECGDAVASRVGSEQLRLDQARNSTRLVHRVDAWDLLRAEQVRAFLGTRHPASDEDPVASHELTIKQLSPGSAEILRRFDQVMIGVVESRISPQYSKSLAWPDSSDDGVAREMRLSLERQGRLFASGERAGREALAALLAEMRRSYPEECGSRQRANRAVETAYLALACPKLSKPLWPEILADACSSDAMGCSTESVAILSKAATYLHGWRWRVYEQLVRCASRAGSVSPLLDRIVTSDVAFDCVEESLFGDAEERLSKWWLELRHASPAILDVVEGELRVIEGVAELRDELRDAISIR